MFPLGQIFKASANVISQIVERWGHDEEQVIPLGTHPLAELFEANAENYKAIKEMCRSRCTSWDFDYYKSFKKNLKGQSNRVQEALKQFASARYNDLSQEKKNCVDFKIYRLARPITQDAHWGENHRFDDIPRFLNALYQEGFLTLNNPLKAKVWIKEEQLQEKSRIYDLDRPPLEKGEIGFINGSFTSFEDAREKATFLSDLVEKKPHIRGVYNASHNVKDVAVYKIMESRDIANEPVLHLLECWSEFFARNKDSSKYLQICYSQGALITEAALKLLPEDMRRRILVLAVAPAAFIDIPGVQVRHLIKELDPVPMGLAKNLHLLDSDTVSRLKADEVINPHMIWGSSYKKAIGHIMGMYIYKNELVKPE